MQTLKSDENHRYILSATRARSHDKTFSPSQGLLGADDTSARHGALNDAAFSHRFHSSNFLREVFQSYDLSLDEMFFLEALERFRYHFLGSDFYRGTRISLKIFQETNLKIQEDKLRDLYFKIISFLENEGNPPKKLTSRQVSWLKKLKDSLEDQALFFESSLKFIGARPRKVKTKKKSSETFFQNSNQEPPPFENPSETEKIIPASKEDLLKKESESTAFTSLSQQRKKTIGKVIKEASLMKDAEVLEEAYKIFTKKYDEIIEASRLTSREEREALCHELESKSMLFKEQINPLAQKLYRFLKTQSPIQWKFDEEEGYLNGSRLSQKIIDPTFRYIYKSIVPDDSLGTAVTVLVDNSGSMRGVLLRSLP